MPQHQQRAHQQQQKGQPQKQQPQHGAQNLVATAVWLVSSALIVALDEHLGEPVDTYVNGSQVWLRPDGPRGITIEYRLHPVGGYERPTGLKTDEVFSRVALALATGEAPIATPETLWGGVEAFVAFDDEGPLEPAGLAQIGLEAFGIPADHFGHADHERIAVRWQQSDRRTSIVDDLVAALTRQL
jgi:hypothetical protein